MYTRLRTLLKIRGIKPALEIGLILLAFTIVKTWMQRNMAEGPPPPVRGALLDGRTFDIQSLQGKPALIHFWASWCGICKLEQDSIESISKDHTVITIAMQSGDADEVQQYMQNHQLSFPVINDPDGEIANRYGVRAVPASFILDSKGEIAFRETGYTTGWGLRIRLWLAQNQAASRSPDRR